DPHSAVADMLGETLQSRAPSLQSWTRNTQSEFAEGGATSPTTLYSKGLPSCSDVDSRRPASRIQAGQNRRVRAFEPLNVFFADHSLASRQGFVLSGPAYENLNEEGYSWLGTRRGESKDVGDLRCRRGGCP